MIVENNTIRSDKHPQCVICWKVFAAKCMLRGKLKRHLTFNKSKWVILTHEGTLFAVIMSL